MSIEDFDHDQLVSNASEIAKGIRGFRDKRDRLIHTLVDIGVHGTKAETLGSKSVVADLEHNATILGILENHLAFIDELIEEKKHEAS